MKRLNLCILFIVACLPSSTNAGTFFSVERQIANAPSNEEAPFAIVHPLGYDGTQVLIKLDICVESGSEVLVGPVQRAIQMWNQLSSTTGNCSGCVLWEENPPTGLLSLPDTVLHEIGHCAMGLDHPNLAESEFDVDGDGQISHTSFTVSAGTALVTDSNGVRGDAEDQHPFSSQDIAWFRIRDNNPVIVDSIMIDKDTYSRATAVDLPSGHNYAASANRGVAGILGFSNTQSVMYSGIAPGTQYHSLAADEVNMVRMGMTGVDRDAGTSDDYTIELRFKATCTGQEDIIARMNTIDENPPPGLCLADIAHSFQQGLIVLHWSIIADSLLQEVSIEFDPNKGWDFGSDIFFSGFENGDFSEWGM